MTTIDLFHTGDTYLFKHYFDDSGFFDELCDYYDSLEYRVKVGEDELEGNPTCGILKEEINLTATASQIFRNRNGLPLAENGKSEWAPRNSGVVHTDPQPDLEVFEKIIRLIIQGVSED